MKTVDPKVLSRQQAQLQRSSRHKVHIGDDTGAVAGRAAELAKVRAMQQAHRAELAAANRPLVGIMGDLLVSGTQLAKAAVTAPFRVMGALRRRPSPTQG